MIAAVAVFAMVFAAGAVLLENSSSVDGASATIEGDTNLVKTGGTLDYRIMFFEDGEFDTLDISYTATLKNSDGVTQSGAVYPSSGTLTNGVEAELTITAPSAAGKYTLTVTFTESIDSGARTTTERTQTVTVAEPIVLSAVLTNNSKVDFTDFAVYFYVDGEFVEGSKTLISAASGDKTTVTYDWVAESLSNGRHTFKIVAGEENIGDYKDVILGGNGEFYVGHSDYGLLNILLIVLIVVMVIAVVYLYRKPVKNYGKPKSRR
ncbi:MAG: hypothetical protein FWG96_00310 [Methanomassiliicoccaceae archaeon]|nr:hypothetical protein [Methanomassiliicoccaceae archaeon]